uniref:Uncharacterized protein n=1 Tax=Naja naja TaxID=35670 RepID=A0A8C6VJN9_NAJNA
NAGWYFPEPSLLRNIGYFNNFEANSRNVSNSMTLPTEASNQDFIILLVPYYIYQCIYLNKIQTAIIGNKSCNLLAILDQLNSNTLPDGRIWLMRSSPKRVGFQSSTQMGLLILLVMPLLFSAVTAQLPGCTKSTALA